jgi:hypothetical protein
VLQREIRSMPRSRPVKTSRPPNCGKLGLILFEGHRVSGWCRLSESAFEPDLAVSVQVRATARVEFGFANPAGVVRLYDAA